MGFNAGLQEKGSVEIKRASFSGSFRLEPLESRLLLSGVTVDPLVTNDPTPPLTGTVGDPAAAIEVTLDGNPNVLLAVNNGDGTWILPDDSMADSLDDGIHDVQVTARALDGSVVGLDETENELTVDTVPPEVTVDTLATNDQTPELTGTVNDPNAHVRVVLVGPNDVGYDAVNNGDGTWTLPDNALSPALADGTYDVTVMATDSVDNSVIGDFEGALRIDTTAPVIGVNGLTTTDTSPALTGTVDDPLATLLVSVNGKEYLAANNGDGTWTLADNTIRPALGYKTYEVRATATDVAGNTASATNRVTIGYLSPWNNFDLWNSLNDMKMRFKADFYARLIGMRTWFASLFTRYPWG
jgi:large repetitive protein